MSRLRQLILLLAAIFMIAPRSPAADVSEPQKLLWAGKYSECIDLCQKSIDASSWAEHLWVCKMRAELATGKYEQALKTYEEAIQRQSVSVQIRLVGMDVLRLSDRAEEAEKIPAMIRQMVASNPYRYSDAGDRVTVARAFLLAGIDARQVLELVLDRAKKDLPDAPEPWIESGELALKKSDLALAAESFEKAAKLSPENPDIQLGLAKAYENDSKRATAALAKALELNPKHVESLLLQADNLVDQESYDDAETLLNKVLLVNPKQSRAWAYRAVLGHLSGDRQFEKTCRDEALAAWKTDPGVDHLIGRKLSQKYRFAEGESYQRQALQFDPNFVPAKIQLCQDLLRLGKEDEGWRLADEVFKEDSYNTLAYNLVTLHDTIKKYKSLESPQFLVRMEGREEQIYGRRVQDLLMRAREKLCAKYGVQLPETVTVEVFQQQKDFAIRTFGLPGGAGFLGVCFGNVVTVNSPASRVAHPLSWEAVVWHEFCHVVTLNKTLNKMPRWLSEGISVYEEAQENPAWGQKMTPEYRELILGEGATPVSKLSGAFLKPGSSTGLMFAYYESSMVVQYVIERYGLDALKALLGDLANDVPINDALAKNTEPIDKLDANFDKWLREQATSLASGADLERPKLPLDAGSAELAKWNAEHPKSFWGLLGEGQALIAEEKFEQAKAPLEKAAALYPGYAEPGGPWLLLAAAYRGLGDTKSERAMLEKHLAINADAIEPRLRMLEITAKADDWPAVKKTAEQILGVNPMIVAPHRFLSQASEKLGERSLAIESQRIMLLMDPLDRAGQHYHLAKLLSDDQQLAPAKKEVILALEEAPRYRDAHRLLLEIVEKLGNPTTMPATEAPAASK